MLRPAILVPLLLAFSAPAFGQQGNGPIGPFRAIADIPTCKRLAISQELAELATAGNQEAYRRMFEAQAREHNCGMLRKGAIVIVRRAVPPKNLVEMMDVNEGILYGPGMMLEELPRKK